MDEVTQTPQDIKPQSAENNQVQEKYVRPTWDEYFLALLEPLGRRGTCDRGRSGSLIVGPGHTIIATGYVLSLIHI